MGFFVTFEGIEGSGKTTQAKLLKEYIEKKGHAVCEVREPGGTPVGEKARAILLNSGDEKDAPLPMAELFLYEAARVELVGKVITPALSRGEIVLCDRFTDSTLAYQAYGRGLSIEKVRSLNDAATGGLKPDVTFIVDCPVDVGLRRAFLRIDASGGGEDRFEREAKEFHERVRSGYLEIAKDRKRNVVLVDGAGAIEKVQKEIRQAFDGAYGK